MTRCLSYCTSSSYKMDLLAESLNNKNYKIQFFDNVIYIQMHNNISMDAIIFPFGCITIWGDDTDKAQLLLQEIKPFEVEPTNELLSDLIYFAYHEDIDDINKDSKTFIEEEKNMIVLGSRSEYLKLSISHALAQSVKLMLLENSVNRILESTSHIQKELAKNGRVSLSQKEISKKIGNLFSERFSINLHSDILDTPEFFWKLPSYEILYLMTADFQDISVRQGILDRRLDIIQELYGILSNEQNNRHSSRMEITIIALIAIETLLALSHLTLSHHDIISKFF